MAVRPFLRPLVEEHNTDGSMSEVVSTFKLEHPNARILSVYDRPSGWRYRHCWVIEFVEDENR